MAQCLGKLQRWDDAGMVANDALHQYGDFENDYQYVFVKARSAEAKGLFEDAEELYTQVIQSANGRQSETAAIAQWRIGEMHFHKEDFKTAIQAYYRVDSLYTFPQWRSAAVLQAGKCQEHLGNWKHAAKLYAQILEKYPDSELAKNASQRLQLVNRLAEKPMQPQRR
jgi:TolA-binding protein